LGLDNFSVREETKMGVVPGLPTGNLGTGTDDDDDDDTSAVALVDVVDDPSSLADWLLRCSSCCFCLSFSLAWKGLGLLSRRLGMMAGASEDPSSSAGVNVGGTSLGRTTAADEELGEMLLLLLELSTAPLVLLNLLLPRLRKPALLSLPRLLESKEGVAWRSELAGEAISVGVASLRVMMATVVRVRPRGLTFSGLVRVRNRLGLITGVLDLAALESSAATDEEARVKSSSASSKPRELSRLGVTDDDTDALVGSILPDSNSTTAVGLTAVTPWVDVGEIPPAEGEATTSGLWVNLMEADSEEGLRLSWSVTEAGRMSVLVSSELVTMVESPSMEVVQ
jgi:hypothetical protein